MGDHLKAIRVVLASLLLASCAKQPTLQALLPLAEARWYAATCRTAPYVSVTLVKAPLPCAGFSNAYGCEEHGVIEISTATPPELMLQVLTHELGHTLNPKHVADNAGIQAPYTRYSKPYITRADIDLVCSERDCPCRRPEQP